MTIHRIGYAKSGLLMLACLLATGCSRRNYNLLPRLADGESPHTLSRGYASGSGSFGRSKETDHTPSRDIRFVQVGTTLGMERGFDFRTVATLSQVYGYGDDAKQANWPAGTLNARLKWNPARLRDFYAATFGIGFGMSQLGLFGNSLYAYGVETSQILGYENPYVVPYLHVRWFVSVKTSSDDEAVYPILTGRDDLVGLKIRLRPSKPESPVVKIEGGQSHVLVGSTQTRSYLVDGQVEVPFKF